jgi:hypothetical protein
LRGTREAWLLNLLGTFPFQPLETPVSRSDIFAIMAVYSVEIVIGVALVFANSKKGKKHALRVMSKIIIGRSRSEYSV